MECDDCEFADWKRTANGRLHPDKSGRCQRLIKHPLDFRLPSAFYWIGGNQTPSGGFIERGAHIPNCPFKSVKP